MEEIKVNEKTEKNPLWAGAIKWTKHGSHRTYGKWRPGQKNDVGVPIKKRWRKEWTTMVQEVSVDIEVGTIVNYITFWKSKIENKDNLKIKLKPNTPMNVVQACKEFWIHPNTFYQHLKRFPALNEKYQELKANRREYLKESAEVNIESALTWGMALSDKDVLDASFKMLEKTDKNYNPKIEIETKSVSINLNKTSDDLYNDLASILWLNK